MFNTNLIMFNTNLPINDTDFWKTHISFSSSLFNIIKSQNNIMHSYCVIQQKSKKFIYGFREITKTSQSRI